MTWYQTVWNRDVLCEVIDFFLPSLNRGLDVIAGLAEDGFVGGTSESADQTVTSSSSVKGMTSSRPSASSMGSPKTSSASPLTSIPALASFEAFSHVVVDGVSATH